MMQHSSGRDWLIFNGGPESFWERAAVDGNLKGLWYDGESTLLAGFCRKFEPRKLLLEDKISERALEVLQPSAEVRVERFEGRLPEESEKPRAVLMSSDTLVHTLRPTLRPEDEIWLPRSKEEGARRVADGFDMENRPMPLWSDVSAYAGLIAGIDWGLDERYQMIRFRRSGVPTVCIQESVIDFGSADRMQWCDYPLIQGLQTLRHLDRELYFLTGNTRYEKLLPTPRPSSPRVLINSNFTYGIHEDVRDSWVEAAVKASLGAGCDYVIAQHPRDEGDLSQYQVLPTSVASIHDALADCSVVITRFSSLIHEALALGRSVVYFNPHRERLFYDFAADGDHLVDVQDPADLQGVVRRLTTEADDPLTDPFFEPYINFHCGSGDGQATKRVREACRLATSGRVERLSLGAAAQGLGEVGWRGVRRLASTVRR